jgi:hypothetical protein
MMSGTSVARGGRAAIWLGLSACVASFCRADDQPDRAADFKTHAKETAAVYEARAGDDRDRPLKFQEEPILRWTNPLGGRQAHGEVFLWSDQGQPAAVLSLYQFTADGVVHEHHEFCSISTEKLHFAVPQLRVWSPPAGVKLQALSDAAAPAESARERLRQMRELAAQFAAEKTTRDEITRTLRLLPQPVYRYSPTRPEVLDGALFAFVEATDPEVLLLLEARRDEQQPAWHFALARMNSVGLRAKRRDQTIWEAPALSGSETFNRKDRPYTAFPVR